MINLARWFFFK